MVYVCRIERFCASHKVFNPAWSEEKNLEVFGPCANANWHGHNFSLIVKVKGKPHPDTGYVLDLKVLSKLIKEHIIEKVDFKNLNIDVDFLAHCLPTCENVIMKFWEILAPLIQSYSDQRANLHSLTLYETENNFVEYFGE